MNLNQSNPLSQADFYINMLKRSWWIVVVLSVVAVNASLVLSYRETPMYRASTTFILSPRLTALEDNRDILNSFFPLNERTLAITLAEILQSGNIFNEAAEFLQIDSDTASHFSASAVVLPESNILQLTVQGPNPIIAQSMANNMGQISVAYFEQLYQVYEINILDLAKRPTSPYSPTPTEDMAIAGFVGFVLGCIIAFFREQLILIMGQR